MAPVRVKLGQRAAHDGVDVNEEGHPPADAWSVRLRSLRLLACPSIPSRHSRLTFVLCCLVCQCISCTRSLLWLGRRLRALGRRCSSRRTPRQKDARRSGAAASWERSSKRCVRQGQSTFFGGGPGWESPRRRRQEGEGALRRAASSAAPERAGQGSAEDERAGGRLESGSGTLCTPAGMEVGSV